MAYHLLALFFALLLPAMLFVSQSVVRKQRGAVYVDVVQNLFPEDHLPQLDLIGAKYGAAGPPRPGAPRPAQRQTNVLVLAALLYAALTFIGFEMLFVPIGHLVSPAAPPPGWVLMITPSFLWTSGGQTAAVLNNTVAVAAMAFLGGYIGAASFLVRQALNYELDGMSFMRSSLLVITGMVVALVAFRSLTNGADLVYRTLNPPTAQTTQQAASQARLPAKPSDQAAGPIAPTPPKPPEPKGAEDKAAEAKADPTKTCPDNKCESPAGWWLGIAFLLGLSPESGLAWLSRRLQLSLRKNPDSAFFEKVRIIPVEIIDGIDSQIAYRLDQNNIEDVQNLATANPIQLYIETPYGLFEVFDWVLQAQLCLVSGADVFLELKRHGIRTIFDLERAVLSDQVPDIYIKAIGEVLFADARDNFRSRLGGAAEAITPEVVRHAVAVIVDDLHVHRLRALWLRIHERSWPTNEKRTSQWLYRSSPLPGDPDYVAPAS